MQNINSRENWVWGIWELCFIFAIFLNSKLLYNKKFIKKNKKSDEQLILRCPGLSQPQH